jgi:hypothetical protein
MTHLHAVMARATDNLKRLYLGYLVAKPRGHLSRPVRSRTTVYLKRSFVG